jgi:ribonuclease G
MGGIIVVDFIDMHGAENKQKVFEKMKEAMSFDRTKHNILPLSKFGLMQITRQRVRPELNIETMEKCPTCKGSGEITPSVLFVDDIENYLSFLINEANYKNLTLKVHPYIEGYIKKGLFSKKFKWFLKFKKNIKVESVNSYQFLEFHFFDKNGEIIKE